MSQFRLWQANRQVFLYPENYLHTELRKDQSPFFIDLANELKQGNCDMDATTAAFENYLRKLVEVRNLVVAAHYRDPRLNGSRVLHAFARTQGTPPKWYYRSRAEGSLGAGIWSAWESVDLDIGSDQVVPFVWAQRLHLVWPAFKQISEKAAPQIISRVDSGAPTPNTAPPSRKFWTVQFSISEFSAGVWQPKCTYAEKCYIETDNPSFAFTFRAFADAQSNLQLEIYLNAHWVSNDTWSGVLVSSGTLAMPDSPLATYSENSCDW
jgi:hypothetical protein